MASLGFILLEGLKFIKRDGRRWIAFVRAVNDESSAHTLYKIWEFCIGVSSLCHNLPVI